LDFFLIKRANHLGFWTKGQFCSASSAASGGKALIITKIQFFAKIAFGLRQPASRNSSTIMPNEPRRLNNPIR
jgi:hypothetical protein